jgi:hypothetical protein
MIGARHSDPLSVILSSCVCFGAEAGPQMDDPDNLPRTCQLCGKPLEEGEELVCRDKIECSERRRFWRTEEGM